MPHRKQYAVSNGTNSFFADRPERLPQAGDVFVCRYGFSTIAPMRYLPGDEFVVLERSNELNQSNQLSSIGNLRIMCKDRTSVWTMFDHMVAMGYLSLKVGEMASTLESNYA